MHIFKMNKQYLANVALKINVIVGGRNTVLVDVTHHHPGEDSSPSIAAVVASQDWPEVTKYAGLVSAQDHRQKIIQDLFKTWHDLRNHHGGMVRELLLSLYRATGQIPWWIIFYSEGQFNQVLLYELDAIQKVGMQLFKTKLSAPQTRHTRLFANNHNATDRSENVLPGARSSNLMGIEMNYSSVEDTEVSLRRS